MDKPVAEVLGTLATQAMDPSVAEDYLAGLQGLSSEHPHSDVVVPVSGPDGRLRWQHWTDRAILDSSGEVVEIQGVGRDITSMKKAEEELAKARDDAERASAAKSRFLAAASHDLRQPMQALSLFINALSRRELDESSAGILERIRECSEALERLLGSLLDISRLEAGVFKPQKRNFRIGELLEPMMAEMLPLAEEKQLDLRLMPSSALCFSDPALLDRVLRNFVTNAIKYTEKGRVLVGCRRAGAAVRIEVWDTGSGIPREHLQRIFEEYHQVGNPARDRRSGLGLGLAIVDRLGRLLDHEVDVRSRVNSGSVFSIIVPLAEEAIPIEAQPEKRSLSRLVGAVVVVIDDEEDIRDGLALLLTSWKCKGVVAASAEDALMQLERLGRAPDFILADYRLADEKTGAEAITLLRGAWGTGVPAALLTGDTGPDRLREATASGLEILHKPIQPERLSEIIASVMEEGAKTAGAVREQAVAPAAQ